MTQTARELGRHAAFVVGATALGVLTAFFASSVFVGSVLFSSNDSVFRALGAIVSVVLWLGLFALSLGPIARHLDLRLTRGSRWLIALATAGGLMSGWFLRRATFAPSADDYPLHAYLMLYACGLLGAVLSVLMTSWTVSVREHSRSDKTSNSSLKLTARGVPSS